MVWGSAGWKSSLAKAAGAEVAAQSRQEKLHAAVARSKFSSQNAKHLKVPEHFWISSDVEKLHAAAARSTFATQNVQNTSAPERFWKLRCQKIARRCSEKHICN